MDHIGKYDKNEVELSARRAKNLLEKDDAKPSMYINDLSKLFDITVSEKSEGEGISGSKRRIICHLAHHDGVSQLELVKNTHMTAPTISVALAKMEKDGLVERVADTHDLRQVCVKLTDKGKEYDEKIRRVFAEADRVLLDGFSDDEREMLMSYFRRMLENLLKRGND